MVTTNYPDGVTSFGVPVIGPGAGELPLIDSGGRYWFVSSVRGDNGNTGTFDSPFATWAFAADATSGNTALRAGDVIVLLPDHAETVIAAGGVTVATAVRIVGIGEGSAKPTLTFGTSTAASVAVTADDVSIVNVIGIGNIDALVNPFNVTGDGFYGDIEWRDATNLKEAVVAVKAEAVSNFKLKLKYSGFIDGSGTTAAFNVNGCSGVRVNIDAYGKFNTGVGRTVDVAATDVEIRGTVYKTGVTDGTLTFTDTATGSTWFAEVFDASAGATYAGGSATAGVMAAADPSAIGTNVSTVLSELAGAAGVASWPTAAAYANGVSIAEVLGYIQNAVRNGSGTALATNKSLQDVIGTGVTGAAGLTLQAAIGTDGTTPVDSATSVLGAIGADNANNAFASTSIVANADGSVLERLEYIQVRAAGSTPATYVPWLGAPVSKTENVNTATGVDLFTVTGKVLITMWTGEVTNAIGAAVTDYKLRVKTDNVDLCAATGLNAAAIGTLFQLNGDAGDTLVNNGLGVKACDTNGKGMAQRIIGLAGGTCVLQSLRTAGDASDAIIHTLWYVPLEAGASVAAA
jgi:hypothetical protein